MKLFTLLSGKRRFTWICTLMVLMLIGVFLRLVWLQLVDGNRLKQLTRSQLQIDYKITTPRGRIVDRDGEEMAVSIMTGSLYVDPEGMKDEPEAQKKWPGRDTRRVSADLLAPVLKMNADKLYAIFNGGGRFVWLKRTMEPNDVEKVRKIIQKMRCPPTFFGGKQALLY